MNDELLDRIAEIVQGMVERGIPIPPEVARQLTAIFHDRMQELEPTPAPQIPNGAELLWILSGGDPDSFVSYLQTIPDPALRALAENPTQLQQVIYELGRRITVPEGEVSGGIPKADLQSSNVYGFQYNPRTGKLAVRFNGGSVYEYEGVPPVIFKAFSAGAIPAKTSGSNDFGQWWVGKIPSLGAAFYELIREGGYPYQKVA